MTDESGKQERQSTEFETEAEKPATGLVSEFVDFLRHNKKWWLLPIIIALLLLGILAALGGSALAPFIYPFF